MGDGDDLHRGLSMVRVKSGPGVRPIDGVAARGAVPRGSRQGGRAVDGLACAVNETAPGVHARAGRRQGKPDNRKNDDKTDQCEHRRAHRRHERHGCMALSSPHLLVRHGPAPNF